MGLWSRQSDQDKWDEGVAALRDSASRGRGAAVVKAFLGAHGPPKTAAGHRVVPVARCVIDVMAEQLAERGASLQGLIFTNRDGKPIEQSCANKALTRVIEPLGWPTGTGYHLFRHYYASLLIHRGLSVKVVQKRLGHATVKETLDTYGHLWPDSDDDTREAIETTLGPIISGGAASPSPVRESVKSPAL